MPFFALWLGFVALSTAQNVSQCETQFGGTCFDRTFKSCLAGYSHSMYFCEASEYCCIPPAKPGLEPPLLPGVCGVTFPDPLPATHRITSGTLTAHGEIPWQTLLESDGSYCGGILISDRWVVTAAHCFTNEAARNPFAWQVTLGEYDRAVVEGSERMAKVDYLIINRNFNQKVENDIAMLRIAKPINVFSKYIRPVCLPAVNESFQDLYCLVTGWGDRFTGGLGTHLLYKASVLTLSNVVCESLRTETVPPSEICAGLNQNGQNACNGDSGGPMVCKKDGVWKVAGIVSHGDSVCSQRYRPAVYTNLAYFRGWIDSVMEHFATAKRHLEDGGLLYL